VRRPGTTFTEWQPKRSARDGPIGQEEVYLACRAASLRNDPTRRMQIGIPRDCRTLLLPGDRVIAAPARDE
jgi:hypothetical protein